MSKPESYKRQLRKYINDQKRCLGALLGIAQGVICDHRLTDQRKRIFVRLIIFTVILAQVITAADLASAATRAAKCKPPYDDSEYLRREIGKHSERQDAFIAGKSSFYSYDTDLVDCVIIGEEPLHFERFTLAKQESIHRSGNVEIRTYKLDLRFRASGFDHATLTIVNGLVTNISWSG